MAKMNTTRAKKIEQKHKKLVRQALPYLLEDDIEIVKMSDRDKEKIIKGMGVLCSQIAVKIGCAGKDPAAFFQILVNWIREEHKARIKAHKNTKIERALKRNGNEIFDFAELGKQ